MIKVKEIITRKGIDHIINDFIETNNITDVIDIKYAVGSNNDFVSALIIYDDKIDGAGQ